MYLYCLVSSASNQTCTCLVERRAENTSLGLQRARLWDIIQGLERGARVIIPERQSSVIPSREEHAFRIDGERVDDGVVATEVEHESAFRALPLFDVVSSGRGRSKRIFRWVDGERTD